VAYLSLKPYGLFLEHCNPLYQLPKGLSHAVFSSRPRRTPLQPTVSLALIFAVEFRRFLFDLELAFLLLRRPLFSRTSGSFLLMRESRPKPAPPLIGASEHLISMPLSWRIFLSITSTVRDRVPPPFRFSLGITWRSLLSSLPIGLIAFALVWPSARFGFSLPGNPVSFPFPDGSLLDYPLHPLDQDASPPSFSFPPASSQSLVSAAST